MNEKSIYSWFKVADSIEEMQFPLSNIIETEINGKHICIINNENVLRACAAKCPHASGRLSEGYVDALGNIVCPIHRYKFSLENGRNSSGEGYFLKTFPVEERHDGIYVGIQPSVFSSWLK